MFDLRGAGQSPRWNGPPSLWRWGSLLQAGSQGCLHILWQRSHSLYDAGAAVFPVNLEVLLTLRCFGRVGRDAQEDFGSSLNECGGGQQLDDWPELAHNNHDYPVDLRAARDRELSDLLDGDCRSGCNATHVRVGETPGLDEVVFEPSLGSGLSQRNVFLVAAPLHAPEDKCAAIFSQTLTQPAS